LILLSRKFILAVNVYRISDGAGSPAIYPRDETEFGV
jgi:hypothetical protein